MKTLILLAAVLGLALPVHGAEYVAISSEGGWYIKTPLGGLHDCHEKSYCEDLAAALNEAHERRTAKVSMPDKSNKKDQIILQRDDGTYIWAEIPCTADSCGKDSQ